MDNSIAKQKICVALDVDTLDEAKDLVKRLTPWVGIFKVGSQLFTNEGPRVVEMIRNAGGEVFLDLKYHDIPTTVMKAALVAAKMGVYVFNVHCLGGYQMMSWVSQTLRDDSDSLGYRRPLILGVTVLTSLSEKELEYDLRVGDSIDQYVIHLAKLAQTAGLDGVVCSSHELASLRRTCGENFILMTPGIRPSWASNDDQKRIMTPSEAVDQGADYLVIGRPITHASSPEEAAERILMEIS